MTKALIRLERVTDRSGEARCEPLFREHLEWVFDRVESTYGDKVERNERDLAHHGFAAELPGLTGARGRLYLVTINGEAAGVGSLKPVSTAIAEIKRMYVRPGQRGQGIARALVEALLADARELGYETVRLDSADFMAEAHDLYRSVGFVDCRPYEDFEGSQHAAIDMQRWRFMSLAL